MQIIYYSMPKNYRLILSSSESLYAINRLKLLRITDINEIRSFFIKIWQPYYIYNSAKNKVEPRLFRGLISVYLITSNLSSFVTSFIDFTIYRKLLSGSSALNSKGTHLRSKKTLKKWISLKIHLFRLFRQLKEGYPNKQ